MASLWTQTVTPSPARPVLDRDITTDTAIVGGGLCGILTAYLLKCKGVSSVVLEADRIGSGQTQNTTAKITSQHDVIYYPLTKKMGREAARLYADAASAAVRMYEKVIADCQIECHFEHQPSYLYTLENPSLLEQEARAASQAGIPAGFTTKTGLPFPVSGAVCFPGQAQFHPLEFLQQIAREVTVYENTRVISAEENILHTEHGAVTAKHIVFATHYPFPYLPGLFFLRMYQERSYAIALKNAPDLEGMYLGIDPGGLSFRNAGSHLILGGGSHRTGQKPSSPPYAMLRDAAEKYFPDSPECAHWSAQDCMPPDKLPYIGVISRGNPCWYTASGFKKWGMTGSMTAAMLLSDQICRIPNRFSRLFAPRRLNLAASFKDLSLHAGISIAGLSKELLHLPQTGLEEIPPGQGGVIRLNGKKTGVYKDPDGQVFAVSTRCPHLGCELSWNQDELTWDCPCHGSRFDYTGKLIDNPARKGLS